MPSLTLLVVEDDLASLELMTETLSSQEARVNPVSNSEEAAGLIQREKFDGIFLDLEMPHISGFDLAREARKSKWNKNTPIIIVTGREDRRTMQQVFEIGATFYLQKPVDRQKLNRLFRTVRGGLMENRRRNVRVPLHTEVACESGARSLRGMTWNLSLGGMQIEVDGLQTGATVRLSFQLPGSGAAIDAVGLVAWAAESRQGIEFARLSSHTQELLRAFIAEAER